MNVERIAIGGTESGEAGHPSPRPGGNGEATPEGMKETQVGLWQIAGYFLKLGTIGFGGPVALAEAMRRDCVERRRWISQDEYQLAFALTNIIPGPTAEQLAFKLGHLKQGSAATSMADPSAVYRHRRRGDDYAWPDLR